MLRHEANSQFAFKTLTVVCTQTKVASMPNTHANTHATHTTRWYEYVTRITEGLTAKEAADRAGFDKSAMTRWKNGMNADPKFAVQFARAFHRNVLEALAEAEVITDEEASLHEVRIGVEDMSTHQLLEELARRIDNGVNHATGLP